MIVSDLVSGITVHIKYGLFVDEASTPIYIRANNTDALSPGPSLYVFYHTSIRRARSACRL